MKIFILSMMAMISMAQPSQAAVQTITDEATLKLYGEALLNSSRGALLSCNGQQRGLLLNIDTVLSRADKITFDDSGYQPSIRVEFDLSKVVTPPIRQIVSIVTSADQKHVVSLDYTEERLQNVNRGTLLKMNIAPEWQISKSINCVVGR